MIKFNIKNILKSPMYALGVTFIVLLYFIIQFPSMFFSNGPVKLLDLSFLAGHFGYVGSDSGSTLVLLLSLLIPLLIILIGTYDNIYGKKYVEEYVIPRVGREKYFKSRAIAIGLVTTLTFIAINLLLIFILAIRYGITFSNSYDVSIGYGFTTMTGITIILSSIIQSIIYGIVASGIFILSQLIRTKRFIDTIILIQLAVIGLHLLLYLTGEIFGYAGYTIVEEWVPSEYGGLQRRDIPGIRSAFIGNPVIFSDLDTYWGSELGISIPDNIYLNHILSNSILTLFVLLVYVGIPLGVYKFKNYLENRDKEHATINYDNVNIFTNLIRKDKLISYALYVLPVLIFILLFRNSSISGIDTRDIPYSEFDIAKNLTFNADISFALFTLPLLFVIIVYQVLREIDLHLDGQVHIRMIRYDSKQKYFINVVKVACLKVLPYLVLLTASLLILLPRGFDYSNLYLVLIPLLLSIIVFTMIGLIMRVLMPIYPALIATGFIIMGSFVSQALTLEMLSEIASPRIVIAVMYLIPIYNYQAIYLRQDSDNQILWLNGIDESAELQSPVLLCIVIGLQIALFAFIFIKVGTKKYKELR